MFFCFLFLLIFRQCHFLPLTSRCLYTKLYRCFGFLDFDLIPFMNLFLSAKLPLHKRIFHSLCGFLNPLIPQACPIFSALPTTWYISEFALRHNRNRAFSNYFHLPFFFFRVSSNQIRSLTQFVGAMLWSMAQLRSSQLRMVVCVVSSCWWRGQLSVLARHTHMPHCPPVPTSSWMLCTDRPQFAVGLESSSVFGSGNLPWRPLLGPIRGDVLGWVRMLPTPASTLPQSMHPSTGPQGWHLASPEPPCYRVYGTWVCVEALHSLWCRVGCASRVSLHSVPRPGWLLSALGQQGLSLLRQGAETQQLA